MAHTQKAYSYMASCSCKKKKNFFYIHSKYHCMKISSSKVLDNKVRARIKINNSEITEIKTKLKPNRLFHP